MDATREKRIFTFIIEGQYYGSHGQTGLPVMKNYKATFMLRSMEAALSTIVKFLLDPYMVKNYGDYARFRTHKITDLKYTGRPPSPHVLQMGFEDMGIAELADFCILKQIFIDPYMHKDLEACRKDIARIYQNRTDQKRQDEKSGRAKEQKEIDDLLTLNQIPKIDPSMPNMNMQRTAASLKNVGDGKAVERVGFDALGPQARSNKPLPGEVDPILNAPSDIGATGAQVEEVPVDNNPELTHKAFEEATARHLGITPVAEDIFA